MSLSARRAWIEITQDCAAFIKNPGRSPQGERGLKLAVMADYAKRQGSLSARRAWIEIRCTTGLMVLGLGRSPQGERGLKYPLYETAVKELPVALRKESVD